MVDGGAAVTNAPRKKPVPRPTGKGKGKGKAVEAEVELEAEVEVDESEEEEEERTPPRPMPKKKGKGKAVHVISSSGEESIKVVPAAKVKRDWRRATGQGEAGAAVGGRAATEEVEAIGASCTRCARSGIACKPRPESKGRHGKKACAGCHRGKTWCSLDPKESHREDAEPDEEDNETPLTILAKMDPPPPPSPNMAVIRSAASQEAAKARQALRSKYAAALAASNAYTAALLQPPVRRQGAVGAPPLIGSPPPITTTTMEALVERVVRLEAGQAGLTAALESLRRACLDSGIELSAPSTPVATQEETQGPDAMQVDPQPHDDDGVNLPEHAAAGSDGATPPSSHAADAGEAAHATPRVVTPDSPAIVASEGRQVLTGEDSGEVTTGAPNSEATGTAVAAHSPAGAAASSIPPPPSSHRVEVGTQGTMGSPPMENTVS